jgi:hypothetical protein
MTVPLIFQGSPASLLTRYGSFCPVLSDRGDCCDKTHRCVKYSIISFQKVFTYWCSIYRPGLNPEHQKEKEEKVNT